MLIHSEFKSCTAFRLLFSLIGNCISDLPLYCLLQSVFSFRNLQPQITKCERFQDFLGRKNIANKKTVWANNKSRGTGYSSPCPTKS